MTGTTVSMAADVAPPTVLDPETLSEAQRQLDICNACRYCEGLCAVFPALERRSVFTEGDVLFLANLCHDCRHCFDACPFATPHEFQVDIPPLMSAIREQTYVAYTRPTAVRSAMSRPTRLRAGLSSVTVLLTLVLGLGLIGWDDLVDPRSGPGAFYDVVPFAAMTVPAFVLSGLAIVFMATGLLRFWRDTAGRRIGVDALGRALRSAFVLENMRGGGLGCTYPDDRPRQRRRVLHSLVFYGFLATFAATVLAAVWQELLGRLPPYPVFSPPVVVGTLGGIATIAGCAGLLRLKARSRRELGRERTDGMDRDFIFLLIAVNGTGLALLLARSTAWMGPLLLLHLGLVAAFFIALPYGKFVHALYRTGALLQDELERRDGR